MIGHVGSSCYDDKIYASMQAYTANTEFQPAVPQLTLTSDLLAVATDYHKCAKTEPLKDERAYAFVLANEHSLIFWNDTWNDGVGSLVQIRWFYLVFFFCGVPIPLWPGGLAYRAVRLRREQRRWRTVGYTVKRTETRVFLSVFLDFSNFKFFNVSKTRHSNGKERAKEQLFTWGLTHVHYRTLMTKPLISPNPFIWPETAWKTFTINFAVAPSDETPKTQHTRQRQRKYPQHQSQFMTQRSFLVMHGDGNYRWLAVGRPLRSCSTESS